ncbi:MAG: UbiA family prenyltransferase [bacterium]
MIADGQHDRPPWTGHGVVHGWLELIRPPNLFTVPGDVLAGASLARIGADEVYLIVPVLFISLFLYISGLLLNDYRDRETDRMERPGRPIPSGRVQPQAALAASMVLMGLALFLACLADGMRIFPHRMTDWILLTDWMPPVFPHRIFGITLGLVALIVLYHGPGRMVPGLGFIIMGLCRGCNVLLGAGLGKGPLSGLVLAGAAAEALYIAAVSAIAAHETTAQPSARECFLLLASLSGLALIMLITGASVLKIGCVLFIWIWVFLIVRPQKRQRGQGDRQVPVMVGKLIRSLILIQAGLIVLAMDHGVGSGAGSYGFFFLIVLLFLFPLSGWAGQRFYGS